MGVPRLDPKEVPFTAPARAERYSLPIEGSKLLEIGAVSIGNPHAVLTVADVDHAPVAEIGEALQSHPAFPEWKGEGEPVYLSGPAEEVFAGEMEWPK
jgi:diaminopimelate epimerase